MAEPTPTAAVVEDELDLPLAGVTVLDFSQFLAGPVAALRLADLGARVIKVERPGTGDLGRTLAFGGRMAGASSMSFHAMNRNKESITADLKDPDDLARSGGRVAIEEVISAARPLVDMLWSREIEGGSFATPERRAALEARINELSKGIRDEVVRRHYRDDLADRLRRGVAVTTTLLR